MARRARALAPSLALALVAMELLRRALWPLPGGLTPATITSALGLLAGLTGVAAVAITRRSVAAQLFAHGVAWLVVASTGFSTWAGGLDARLTGMLLAAALALGLGRERLHDALAQSSFAPRHHAMGLRAGMVTASAVSVSALLTAYAALRIDPLASALLAGFTALLFASAHAVARMRAWGLLFGAAASIGLFAVAFFRTHTLTPSAVHPGWDDALVMVIALVPALAFLAPVMLARLPRAA